MTCPAFPLPNHGSVLLPCIELVGFSCMAKCREGYYLSGNHTSKCVVDSGITTWVPNNAICEGKLRKIIIFSASILSEWQIFFLDKSRQDSRKLKCNKLS